MSALSGVAPRPIIFVTPYLLGDFIFNIMRHCISYRRCRIVAEESIRAMSFRHQPAPAADRAVFRVYPVMVVVRNVLAAYKHAGYMDVHPDLMPVLTGKRGVRDESGRLREAFS
jgi:hypothetical protein